jgi:NAD(P)-dependent dehydrogenase (short-subunit alcohol dehydrogenase family)
MEHLRQDSATDRTIAVFGAYGHTGRFVVSELRNRGWTPILCGRDPEKLAILGASHPELSLRVASIDHPAALDRALAGADAVINCAGPFLDTAPPIIEAALRARIHYLDLAAEQGSVIATFERFSVAARDADIAVVPAMAFYGGLGDLLATAAMGDWTSADEIRIGIALDSWLPTRGTRLTGMRNTAKRLVVSGNRLQAIADPPPTRRWEFPAPFGTLDVVGLPLSEIITISRHLHAPEIHAYMNLEPLKDLRDPQTPAPVPADASGRSSQRFLVEVVVRKGGEQRHAVAHGRDIYAVTAPLVVEAAVRVVTGLGRTTGVATAGEIFDARDFLGSLQREDIVVEIG